MNDFIENTLDRIFTRQQGWSKSSKGEVTYSTTWRGVRVSVFSGISDAEPSSRGDIPAILLEAEGVYKSKRIHWTDPQLAVRILSEIDEASRAIEKARNPC